MHTKRLVSLLTASSALVLAATSATAQVDVNPPMPNIMLLVDSSGSMERRTGTQDMPTCNPAGVGSQKSRWIEMVEVLTGTVQGYACYADDRKSNGFKDEFRLPGVSRSNLYDADYVNPYHRIVSNGCVVGPNMASLQSNDPYAFPNNTFTYHRWDNRSTACSGFGQNNDGLLDTYSSQVRFGLMTFDSAPNRGRGLSGSSANYLQGNRGLWSYFLGGAAATGHPAGCDPNTINSDLEVGARNAAAPPWEGRMVAFGSPTANASEISTRNQMIQQVLVATRPYGATPIDGMMNDARDFFWNDGSNDPVFDPSEKFGPSSDPFVNQGCRNQAIVLLTDGEPNLDLRPFCEQSGTPNGKCPYPDRAEDVAEDLATAANQNRRIQTYVVGYALDTASGVDCTTMSAADLATGGLCDTTTDEALRACCTLNKIAYKGGTNRAFFVQNGAELRNALNQILSDPVPSTSRTLPVFAQSTGSSGTLGAGFRFFTSFEPRRIGLWEGVLERQRFICTNDPNTGTIEPEEQPIETTNGDDFVSNVNTSNPATRLVYSVAADQVSSQRYSERSVRPSATTNPDGISGVGGTQYGGTAPTFVTNTPADAMEVTAASCSAGSATACRDEFMRWNVGLSTASGESRCPNAANCSLIGDIFHSTPVLVGRPNADLRDESYDLFRTNNQDRPLILYTATNDGFLQAFDTSVTSQTSNLLWSFIPPAVLPSIQLQYPGSHMLLLDGMPVVQDVPATQIGTSNYRLERTEADAQAGGGTWRTILVMGFGSGRAGYFALDVTEPEVQSGQGGPRFLWQLTTDEAGNPLFGVGGGTPLITTVFIDANNVKKEVAVAVLPGGAGGPRDSGTCQRLQTAPQGLPPSYGARTRVSCYPQSANGARSLTIVRLDNGEIIKTFRPGPSFYPASLDSTRVITAPLDSPITGRPAAFPGGTGTVAERIFVGDADGTMWVADLSDPTPNNWNMEMFFDAYTLDGALDGQPIVTEPVVSVDQLGQVTVAFSTGDQEVLTADTGMKNYVWSLTQKLNTTGTSFESEVNWYTRLLGGERVAGPLTLFNGQIFFSTFQPEPANSANACRAGSSRVWGVDYILPEDTGDASAGGKARLPDNNTLVQSIDSSSTLIEDGATIFGVGVAQLPTCTDTQTTTDPYLGFGTHTALTNVNPGKYQLVMHTGSAGSSASGGKTNITTIDLPTPPANVVIDSWAAYIDGP